MTRLLLLISLFLCLPAEKLTDVGRRDQSLSFALTASSKNEPAEKVLSVIDESPEALRRCAAA